MVIPYGLSLDINCLFLCFGILHLYLTDLFNVNMYNTYFNDKSSFCLVGVGVAENLLRTIHKERKDGSKPPREYSPER